MRRRQRAIKPKASKVRVKSMYEHVQGTTIRQLGLSDLPTGCSVLTEGIPCTFRMTHIALRVSHAIWAGDEQPNIIMEGFCKRHRPKLVDGAVLDLPDKMSAQVNGGRSVRSRIKRMEKAMFVDVVPQGGILRHSVLRTEVQFVPGTQWVSNVTTVCDKRLKRAYVPTARETRNDYPDECKKCSAGRTVVPSEEV